MVIMSVCLNMCVVCNASSNGLQRNTLLFGVTSTTLLVL